MPEFTKSKFKFLGKNAQRESLIVDGIDEKSTLIEVQGSFNGRTVTVRFTQQEICLAQGHSVTRLEKINTIIQNVIADAYRIKPVGVKDERQGIDHSHIFYTSNAAEKLLSEKTLPTDNIEILTQELADLKPTEKLVMKEGRLVIVERESVKLGFFGRLFSFFRSPGTSKATRDAFKQILNIADVKTQRGEISKQHLAKALALLKALKDSSWGKQMLSLKSNNNLLELLTIDIAFLEVQLKH